MTIRRSDSPRRRLAVGVAGALLVSVVALPATAQPAPPVLPEPDLTEAPAVSWPDPSDIAAAAYVLVEAATGQRLAERAADTSRPVASTVKLLTAWSVIQRSDLDDPVMVGEEVVGVTGSGAGVEPGEQWTVEELLDGLLSRSGNDAAEALAVHVGGTREAFLDLMEADAAALGVRDLDLKSPSGLDDTQVLSAHDLSRIALAILQDDHLPDLLDRRIVALPGQPAAETRNELLERYRGATGMKTGFTTAAGYSLVGSARRGGRDLVAVVLGAGEDPARFEAAAALLDFGYDDTVITEVATAIRFAVAGGDIALEVPPTPITVPADSAASLQLNLPVRPPEAPVPFPILVDGEELGVVEAAPTGRPAAVTSGSGQLGRALVDGAYAALRAASAAGTL